MGCGPSSRVDVRCILPRFAGKSAPTYFERWASLTKLIECSAFPFAATSLFFGWEIVVPIYFGLHISLSRAKTYYYPSPRAISLHTANSLPIALTLTYVIPLFKTLQSLVKSRNDLGNELAAEWQTAHLAFPAAVFLLAEIHKRTSSSLETPGLANALYGNFDIKGLLRFQKLVFLVALIGHLVFLITCLPQLLAAATAVTTVKLCSLTLSIFTWCCYTAWEMRRVYVLDVPLWLACLYVAISTVFVGPAATLAGTWRWRETALEKSRTRQGRVCT